jgi:ATP-dependent RNA helicase DeaD
MLFEDLKLSNNLLNAIKRLGLKEPTKIQELAIPPVMEGKDVIGESATGSGKTLAFGCGIVENIESGKGIQSLILTPTRELAEQVCTELRKFSHQKSLKIIPVYGGVSIDRQIHELLSADVVVATPGRLLDHLQRRTIGLSKVKLLVMDEADRMFDMGFIDDVEKIIRACPKKRQTLFFSATISTRVKELGNVHMKNPVIVAAKKHVDPSKLKQVFYNVPKNVKLSLLVHLLEKEKSGLVMIFCNTRRTTDFVSKSLKANGIKSIPIHGGMTQNKRLKTIDMFHHGDRAVLVCTDVAARGLHIDNVSHIYNYEIPNDSKDYVHRIGRTARAGEEGKVINLLAERDYDNFSRIQDEYRNFNIKKLEAPKLRRVRVAKIEIRRKPQHGRRRFGVTRQRR